MSVVVAEPAHKLGFSILSLSAKLQHPVYFTGLLCGWSGIHLYGTSTFPPTGRVSNNSDQFFFCDHYSAIYPICWKISANSILCLAVFMFLRIQEFYTLCQI